MHLHNDHATEAQPAESRRAAPCQFLAPLLAAGLAWLALGATPAFALSTDRDKPIEIEADRAEADQKERVTIYRGDAIITQGSLTITGETVWIYFNEDDEFIKLVSQGEPARLKQLPDGSEDYQVADANRVEYYAKKDLILLLGNAAYGQGADRIQADQIEYDSLRGKMLARAAPATDGAGKSKSRVRIQIVPKKKSN